VVNRTSVVQINGNQYDAATGAIIGTAKKIALKAKAHSSGVIDGFTAKPSHLKPVSKPQVLELKKTVPLKTAVKPSKPRPKHSAHKLHSRAERSHTLMRRAVRRPMAHLKARPVQTAPVKARVVPASSERESRAKKITKHAKIHRFGSFASTAKVEPEIITPARVKVVNPRPAMSAATQTGSAPSASAAVRPLPSMVTSVSHQQLERLLDHALAKADAHKQILRGHKAKKSLLNRFIPRVWAAVIVTTAILAIAGFLAWQNLPQFSMRVAAIRTGVQASVPAYAPSGFNFAAPVSYNAKSVTLHYRSTTDPTLSFTLTQQASNLDSESLAKTVIPVNTQVQTSQVDGTTVFIHGADNDAAWVNRGIWYTIDNSARLSSNQLLRIVESL
jgi:hypothetical protein